jgi:hypothetical protein
MQFYDREAGDQLYTCFTKPNHHAPPIFPTLCSFNESVLDQAINQQRANMEHFGEVADRRYL